MTPLHLTQDQLDTIRANSLNDEAYQATLKIIANQTPSNTLANSQQCVQLFLETALDPIVIYDKVGHVAHVNTLFTQVFGWTAEEIQGERLDFVPEENQQETAQAIQALMENGRVERFETRRYCKDGTIINTEISANIFTNQQDGSYDGMIEVLRDLSHPTLTDQMQIAHESGEKLQTKHVLESNEAKFKTLVENSITAIYIIQDGYYTYVNEAFTQITGFTAEELMAQPILDFIHPEDEPLVTENVRRRLMGEVDSVNYRLRFITKNGSYLILEVFGAASEYHGKPAVLGSMLDVTVQQRTQHRLKLALESGNISIWEWDLQTNEVHWSDNAANVLGIKDGNFEGTFEGFATLIHPEDQAPFGELVQFAMQNGGTHQIEIRLIPAEGKLEWVDSYATVIFNDQNQPVRMIGTVSNITALRQSEQQLRERENLLQLILDNIPQSVFWKDRDLIYLGGNQKFAQDVGADDIAEIVGRTDYDFPWTAEEAELYIAEGREVIEANQPKLGLVEPQHLADGSRALVETNLVPLHDEQGEVVGVLGAYQDVTEREAAREQIDYQAKLLQVISDAVIAVDENFNIQAWNQAAEEMYGFTEQEVHGKFIGEFVRNEYYNTSPGEGEKMLREQGLFADRARQFTTNGRELHIDSSSTLLTDENGNIAGFVAVNRNITELIKAEENLQQSQQRLAQLVEQSPLAFVEWDENFCVREWNKAAEHIFGYTRKEALGQHAKFILTEEVWPVVDTIWEHLTNLTGGERNTNNNITADGREIICDWYNTSITDTEGNVTGVVSIAEDISERVKQEQATEKRQKLIEKQSQLSLLISEEMITSQGRQHALQIITEEATNMLDVGRASIWTYQPDPQTIHLLDLFERKEEKHSGDVTLGQDAAPSYFKALENERILVANDVQEHYSTQELLGFYLEPLKITSLLDTFVRIGDQVRGVVCLEHTGPKREWSLDEQSFASFLADLVAFIFEEEERHRLQVERNRLSSILESTIDFVSMADYDGNITYLNAAGRKMAGLPIDVDLTQLKIESLIAKRMRKSLSEEVLPKAIEQGYWQGESIMIHQQDQHEIPISQVIITNSSSEGEFLGFSTIVRDITEQKQQEHQIQLRLELNQALDEARTENETLKIVTEKARFYPHVGVGITRREIIDGQIVDVMIQQAPFESALEQLPEGAPITFEPATLEAVENDHSFYSNNFGNDDRLGKSSYETSARTGVNSIAVIPIFVEGNERYGSLIAVTSEADFFDTFKVDLYRTLAEQTSISLRSVRLNEQIQQSLERRGRQVQITTQIAQEIASSTEIYELYQRVVELTKEEFGYYHTQLLQYNPALDAVALIVGYGEAGQQMLEAGHSMPLGVGIIGTAAATGQSVLRTDVRKDPNWRPNNLLPDTRAELAVPIKLGSEVLGILDVQSDQIGTLTEEDQLVLEGLCGQIAVAIEGTRLRQDMNERLQELNNLQRLMTREGWESVQTGQAVSHAGYVFDQQGLQPVSQPTNGASNGHSLNTQLSAQVVNPIKIRDEVIGTIQLEDTADNPLSREDEELLDAISRQVAEALENARLIEQTRKRALELETVARVSATTSTILEVEQLLQSVARLTQSSFGLSHAHIYMLDEDRRSLKLLAGTGEVGALMVAENWQVVITDENSVVSRVARARRGMVISDVRQETHHRPNPFMPDNRAELAVPMIAGDELLGVLDLHSSTVNFFSNEDLRIHTTLATQVAVALQNANLYQEQLETAEKLREFDRLKSQFLASMSHELRTPLNSIIGFADVLLEGIDGELNDRMREDVLLIRDGGQHLRALIGDILDMSKIEAGMMDLTYGTIDMQRIAQEVMATTQGLVTEKPINLILDMDETIETIEADRTRVVQILLNLLSNAAKFTDEGAITLSMHRQDDEFMLVGVKDTGVGIKPENVKMVFEQFQQIGGMEHRKAGGTGLGMPITKQLVEMHGGKIWIDSVPGVGSTFWFTLPISRPEGLDTQRGGYYA